MLFERIRSLLSGPEWEDGQAILLVQDGCPACEEMLEQDWVQDARADGALKTASPTHRHWNRMLDEAGVETTPEIIVYQGGRYIQGNL